MCKYPFSIQLVSVDLLTLKLVSILFFVLTWRLDRELIQKILNEQKDINAETSTNLNRHMSDIR